MAAIIAIPPSIINWPQIHDFPNVNLAGIPIPVQPVVIAEIRKLVWIIFRYEDPLHHQLKVDATAWWSEIMINFGGVSHFSPEIPLTL